MSRTRNTADLVSLNALNSNGGNIGIGTTARSTETLFVEGDSRITGILTVGSASVTIDGDSNTVNVGLVTITNSEVVLGNNVTINASATGINSAPNVFYVAKDGNDNNNGTSIDNAKLTIASAVGVAQSGSVIKVLSGNYVESNPIVVPAFVAVVAPGAVPESWQSLLLTLCVVVCRHSSCQRRWMKTRENWA